MFIRVKLKFDYKNSEFTDFRVVKEDEDEEDFWDQDYKDFLGPKIFSTIRIYEITY